MINNLDITEENSGSKLSSCSRLEGSLVGEKKCYISLTDESDSSIAEGEHDSSSSSMKYSELSVIGIVRNNVQSWESNIILRYRRQKTIAG